MTTKDFAVDQDHEQRKQTMRGTSTSTREQIEMTTERQNKNWNFKLTDERRFRLLEEYGVWEEELDAQGQLKRSRLVLPALGELIYSGLGLHFLTLWDSGEIYFYNGGYYEGQGEQIIKDLAEQLLRMQIKEHFKNEIVGYIRDKNYQRREIFNVPLNLINLQNGVYNIETGELLEKNPEYYFLHQIPVDYDPKAKCPRIKKFLREIFYQDDIPVVQEFIGYCLYRRYHIHRAVMLLGEGNNGKSTFINLLTTFLGRNNVSNKTLQELLENRFATASLYGKLLNAAPDIPTTALKRTGIFKCLTGEDRIYADVKFRNGFEFTNHAKLIFSTNTLPKAYDDTYAFFRRWLLLSFPNTFERQKRDPHILEKITTNEELSGLFNWAIEGLKRLLENGEFSYSKSVDEITEQYKSLSDPTYAYIQEFLEVKYDSYIPKVELRKHYFAWCKENKLPMVPENVLTRRLKDHIPELQVGKIGGRGRQKAVYKSIGWKTREKTAKNKELF